MIQRKKAKSYLTTQYLAGLDGNLFQLNCAHIYFLILVIV